MSADAGGDPRAELEAALAALERAARGKRLPTRFDARALLLPLGALVDDKAPEVASTLERLARLPEPLRAAWREAVGEELSLAVAEHLHGVDRRYLDHPRYDFEYTLAARERLERRLRAAAALGLDPPQRLLELVGQADAVLAEAIARRGGIGC